MGLTEVNIALVTLVMLAASAQQEMQAEIALEHTIQYQGLLPATGDYVRYTITITNTGVSAIEGQKLWVAFAPPGKGDAYAVFVVPHVAQGESVQIHAGPFKMHSVGEHLLAFGMNSQGQRGLPDDVAMNIVGHADSVTAYSPLMAATLPLGMGLIFAGIGVIVWRLAHKRNSNV